MTAACQALVRRPLSLFATLCAFAGVLLYPAAALSQSWALPPVRSTIDSNGVDLRTGQMRLSAKDVTIGQPGAGGLEVSSSLSSSTQSYADTKRFSFTGGLETTGAGGDLYTTIWIGDSSDVFSSVTGTSDFGSMTGRGATLTYDGSRYYLYTMKDGTAVTFDSLGILYSARISLIVRPDGERLTFNYSAGAPSRLQSITNNFGYQLRMEYESNVAGGPAFSILKKVYGVNAAAVYCDPLADTCPAASGSTNPVYPLVEYSDTYAGYVRTITATDTLGRVRTYKKDDNTSTWAVRLPGSTSDDVVYAFTMGLVPAYPDPGEMPYPDGIWVVSSVTTPAGVWKYQYFDNQRGSGKVERVVITDPQTNVRTVTFDEEGRVATDTNALGETVELLYDPVYIAEPPKKIINPEGDAVEYSYGPRVNVTEVRRKAKPGSGLADTVETWAYPSTCTNVFTCNKPTSYTDAKGAVTDYTYDATHGGLLTATSPAPTIGAVRPQERRSYSQLYAWYKNSSGAFVQAPTPVWRLMSISACKATASCTGTADETKATVGFGPTGVANNLLPTTSTVGAGDGSLTATNTKGYDEIGNLVTVDGPLAGADDTTTYRYDAGRQTIAVISPDPDGGGARKPEAQRTTYNSLGQPTLVEMGTVTSAATWNTTFTSLEQAVTDYDALRRKSKESTTAAGATQTVVQYSYDALGRPVCTALRMNPAAYGSLPASACALGTTGANGPDRITQLLYDAAGRPIRQISALGASWQQQTVVSTFTPNGQIATQRDANGNLTTYEYDGFDRLAKVRYPSPTVAGTSSTTDFKSFTYDANDNLATARQRDTQVVSYTFDALNRETVGIDGIITAYNNIDQVTSTSVGGLTTSFGYDALGRRTTETGPLGTVAREFDLADRRTRLTWADGFYVTYDNDLLGNMTAIRENGAASGVGVLATFSYDALSRRTSITRGNTVSTSYAYDSASRLQTLAQDMSGSSADRTLGFTYNAVGQILTRTDSNSAYEPPVPPTGTQAYTANGLNQMTSSGGVSLTYDARGNMTSDGVKTYGYDIANQLTSAPGVTLTYDPLGRLYRTAGASTTRFAYDDADMIAEYDAAGVLQKRYVHGPRDDEPLVWYEGAGTTDRRWLIADELGSVVGVTNAAGASIAINTYDEYGVPGASNTGRFQYTGQMWIAEVGLYHFKARFYSPMLGRFLQTDPIGYADGMNLYVYVGNDPVNLLDPSGHYGVSDPNGHRERVSEDVVDLEGITITADPDRVRPGKKAERRDGFGALMQYISERPALEFVVSATPGLGTVYGVAEFIYKPSPGTAFGAVVGILPGGTWVRAGFKGGKAAYRVLSTACCFEAGTLVETEFGLRPIETIKVGDRVLSRDPTTGETKLQPVVALVPGHKREIYEVTVQIQLAGGGTRSETFRTTEEHPWGVQAGGWLETQSLIVGTQLITSEAGLVTVRSIRPTGEVATTYNIEVAQYHTYFVGELRVWAHNQCYSEGRRILEAMAKADKRKGVTRADVEAYQDLNRTLPDPIPRLKVRVDEGHPTSTVPVNQEPHAHIGDTGHIPIIDP